VKGKQLDPASTVVHYYCSYVMSYVLGTRIEEIKPIIMICNSFEPLWHPMTAMSAFPINKNNDLPLLSFQICTPQQEPSKLVAMRKDNKKKQS
jgi:hypothetical protein